MPTTTQLVLGMKAGESFVHFEGETFFLHQNLVAEKVILLSSATVRIFSSE
jgi:hypothetical protein